MRLILLSLLLFIGLSTFAQNITNHEVEPKGEYREINLSKDIKVIQRLVDTTANSSNTALIDSIKRNANIFTPPVLYVLSNILFNHGKYNDACFWFYVAQLRARYDVNRCTDKTATPSSYNENFGPNINGYAFKHPDSLKAIIEKVVNYVRANEELYDQRWINLTGMGAFTSTMSDKPAHKKLSIDKSKWPAIKKKTIGDYYEDFEEALGVKNNPSVDRSNMLGYDYRLFEGTQAWELSNAVRNQDTVKIITIVSENKALIEAREPKFGQTLLLMAVKTLKFESVKTLIALGADPNAQDTYDGTSPLIEAANIDFLGNDTYGSDPRYLKLLLEHGGDPNAEEKGVRRKGNSTRYTPLLRACSIHNFEYVKLLVEAGANVNYNNEYGMNPLGEAVMIGMSPDIVLYLLNKGADYHRPIYPGILGGSPTYITEGLRDWRFDLNSEDYKKKMQIVDFLQKNGMDYRKTKIPEEYLKNYPKDYLEKY